MRLDALTLSGEDSGLSVSLVLYRGATTLTAQYVRLVPSSLTGVSVIQTDGTESAQYDVMVVGAEGLDIQSRDRFNVGGVAYEVESVKPNRYAQTTAIARAIQ
jgi:hypothetical protein